MLEQIVQQYSVEVVVERTKISRSNLQKLLEADFANLTRPQAYGFVAIIEREFGVQLDELRALMDQYYADKPTMVSEPIFIKERERVPGGEKSRKWVPALLAAAALGLGWYLYDRNMGAEPTEKTETPVVQKSVAPISEHKAEAPQKEALKASSLHAESESNATQTTQTADDRALQNAPAEESEPEPYVPLDPVVIEPTVKLWMGTIDLKTGKRKARTVSGTYEVDSHGKKLLLTGHGRFEISDGEGNFFKFNDAKKHYFYIEEGLLREIDETEFKRLNGGKIW